MDGASAIIKVEEYKRPTFDVVFTPYEDTYNMGDSIVVKGEAKTFAGAPVRMAKVKYTISRSEYMWFRMGGMNKVELDNGEVQTDADGNFSVRVVLTAPETTGRDMLEHRYYVYEVQAEVTDGADETQTNTLSLPVGKQSLGLQIRGLSGMVMREKQEKVQFMALNLNGTPVQTEVAYRVFALDNAARKPDCNWKARRKLNVRLFLPNCLHCLRADIALKFLQWMRRDEYVRQSKILHCSRVWIHDSRILLSTGSIRMEPSLTNWLRQLCMWEPVKRMCICWSMCTVEANG